MAPASSARETMIGSPCMLKHHDAHVRIVRADAADQRQAAEPVALHRQIDDHDLRAVAAVQPVAGDGVGASSTRSTPASSSIRRHPWRTIGWSSMTRTLVMTRLSPRIRIHTQRVPASSSGSVTRTHVPSPASLSIVIAAAQAFDALLHAANAETGAIAGMNPTAVVAHAQCKLRLRLRRDQRDGDVFACAWRTGIGQTFLYAAKMVRSIESP